MKEPGDHPREARRLGALAASGLQSTPAEHRFDIIIETARRLFDVPIALFTLVTATKQSFKSASGLWLPHTPRAVSFCGHAILTPDVFVVDDALKDPRFADNPLVTGDPNIRFYAGCPIYGLNDMPLGTICIIDTRPRHLDVFERKQLRALAQWLTSEVRNRGLSETELRYLNGSEENLGRLVAEVPKCWNRAAGETLLTYTLDAADEDQQVAALLIEFLPESGDWSDLPEDFSLASRAWMGNLLRRVSPEGAILAALADTQFLVVMPDLGRVKPVAFANQFGATLDGEQDPDIPLSWRGALLPDVQQSGRVRNEVIQQLVDAAPTLEMQRITVLQEPGRDRPTG